MISAAGASVKPVSMGLSPSYIRFSHLCNPLTFYQRGMLNAMEPQDYVYMIQLNRSLDATLA